MDQYKLQCIFWSKGRKISVTGSKWELLEKKKKPRFEPGTPRFRVHYLIHSAIETSWKIRVIWLISFRVIICDLWVEIFQLDFQDKFIVL